MRKCVASILTCACISLALTACSGVGIDLPFLHMAEKTVPITSEPHHHLSLQNPYVRVFKVEAPPHGTTLVHRHEHDYVFIVLGASQITNVLEGKSPVQQRIQDGAVMFVPGGFAHKVTNDADTPFRNVTVEILQPKKDDPAKVEDARGLDIGHGAMSMAETLFMKDGVKASEMTLNPGGMLHVDSGKPGLIVALSGVDLRQQVDTKSDELHLQVGDFRWTQPAGPEMLTNVGKSPARFVLLEFE
jgi:hypothetical protein